MKRCDTCDDTGIIYDWGGPFDCGECDIIDRAKRLIHDTDLSHQDAGPQTWADLTDKQRAYWIALAKQETP